MNEYVCVVFFVLVLNNELVLSSSFLSRSAFSVVSVFCFRFFVLCFFCRSFLGCFPSSSVGRRRVPSRRGKSAIDLARSGWYEKIVMAIVRPPRCKYTLGDLGPELTPLRRCVCVGVCFFVIPDVFPCLEPVDSYNLLLLMTTYYY